MFHILLVLVGCHFGGGVLLKCSLLIDLDDPGYGLSRLTGVTQGGVTGSQIEMNVDRVQQSQAFQRGHGILILACVEQYGTKLHHPVFGIVRLRRMALLTISTPSLARSAKLRHWPKSLSTSASFGFGSNAFR